MSFLICDRCGCEGISEIEEGFILCEGCLSVYNNCINEPNEKRTKEDFLGSEQLKDEE